MSNARDKANIPALNFSSTGIDDNATSTAITINSSENVGINETSPEQKLHITSGGTTYMRVENTTLGCVTDFGTTSTGSTIINRSAHPILFWTDTTERMRIDSSGNVGIGVTTPDAKLDVYSQINVTDTANNSLQALTGSRFGYSATYRCLVIGGVGNGTDKNIAIGYDPSGNSSGSFTGTGGEILFKNGIQFKTPNAADDGFYNNLFVMKDGNIGIGTNSPAAQFHVYNYSGSTGFRVTRGNNITGVNMHMSTDSTSNYFNAYGNLFFGCSATGTGTGASERLGINTSGDISSNSGNITGSFSRQNVGITYIRSNAFVCTRSSGQPLEINRTTNDGNLVVFYQNDTAEGSITVSGTTVLFNGYRNSLVKI